MTTLFWNADDFGKSETANHNILQLVELKKVQRVSILINGFFSKEELEKLKSATIKLDLHLTLPKTDFEVEKESIIHRSVSFIHGILKGRNSSNNVRQAWIKQIEKFKKNIGRYPDGINSHEHVHFFPAYFKVLLRLCDTYHIKYIRAAGKKIIDNKSNIGLILRLLNSIDRKLLSRKSDVNYCDYLSSLDWIPNIDNFLQKIPEGSMEIFCHPERANEYEIVKNQNSSFFSLK